MNTYTSKSFTTTHDIIDFMDLEKSSTVVRFNLVGYCDVSQISGTNHYITVLYSTDIDRIDDLIQTILSSDIEEVNTTDQSFKDKLLETGTFVLAHFTKGGCRRWTLCRS